MLIYFEGYRNNDIISTIAYFSVIGGWILLYFMAIKGTLLEDKTDEFSKVNPEPFAKRALKTMVFLAVFGLGIGNAYWMSDLGDARRAAILDNQPTQSAIAIVDRIETKSTRSGIHYYAIFEYKAGLKNIEHRRYEQQGEFLTGEKFEIKYSVDHPEMFKIMMQLPPTIN